MLRPSFIPPQPIRRLRDLTRLRISLTRDRARYRQRIQDTLEDTGIKIADKDKGVSDLFGVSGRAMLDALVAGQRNPAVLAALARGAMRRKIPFLTQALDGAFEDHHAGVIKMLLELHDGLSAQIGRLDTQIEAAIVQIDPTPPPDVDHPGRMPLLDRLDEIPGIGRETAQVIIAEIGCDMTCFPTPGHLASWAKLTPRTIQSGTKSTQGKAGKGNGWLKGALGQSAVNAGRTKTFLGARYRRIIKHAPKKKAVVAISRNILEIAWSLLADPDTRFHDLGPDWHDRHINRTRKTRQAVRDLEQLGYTVTLTTTA